MKKQITQVTDPSQKVKIALFIVAFAAAAFFAGRLDGHLTDIREAIEAQDAAPATQNRPAPSRAPGSEDGASFGGASFQ